RGRRARGAELPWVRGIAPGAVRRARRVRAGGPGPHASAADRALLARARPDDVRTRVGDVAAVARVEDPRARRAGPEPPGAPRADPGPRRGEARAAQERTIQPGVRSRGRTAGARRSLCAVPGAQAR